MNGNEPDGNVAHHAVLALFDLAPLGDVGATRAVTLEMHAPAECPGHAALEDAVRTRTPRVTFERGGERIEVRIEGESPRFRGEVRGASGDRNIAAEDCAQVVDGLGLIIALAFDPEAALVAPAPAPPRAPLQAPALLGAEATGAPRAPREGATTFSVLGLAGVHARLAPDPAIGGAARASWSGALLSGFGSMDAGVGVTVASTAMFAGRASAFTLAGVHADGCGWGLEGRAVSIHLACLAVDVGYVGVEGAPVAKPVSQGSLWLDAGVLPRITWRASPSVSVRLELGLSAPIVRPTYVVRNPDAVLYEVPPFVASIGLGLRHDFDGGSKRPIKIGASRHP